MREVDTANQKTEQNLAGESRRARLRRELTADIVRIARRQLTEAGPGAVTWRAVARELGMNPASLYTYFASLDELFTTLILESYQALGDAVREGFERAGHLEPVDHVVATALAYRHWAVDHPAEFNLIFTDQIPGYVAPTDAGTYDAEMAVLRPLLTAIGRVTGRHGNPADQQTADSADADAPIGLWAMVHGYVALEVNNHLPVERRSERFESIVRNAIAAL